MSVCVCFVEGRPITCHVMMAREVVMIIIVFFAGCKVRALGMIEERVGRGEGCG